jgi:hypothetical protein
MRIALAAETLLYLPVHLVVMEHEADYEVVCADGDEAAYQRLGAHDGTGPADLCVCDPMALVLDLTDPTPNETKGRVIASLVNKTGLWGLMTPKSKLEVPPTSTLFRWAGLQPDGIIKIPAVLSYSNKSTGGKVVTSLERQGIRITNHYSAPVGKELLYLTKPYRETVSGKEVNIDIDMVITCDYLGVLYNTDSRYGVARASRPSVVLPLPDIQGYNDNLFTSVIASHSAIAEREKDVSTFAARVQQQLNRLSTASVQDLERIAARLKSAKWLSAHVGSGKLYGKLSESDMHALIIDGITKLRNNGVFARRVTINGSSWDAQFKMWFPKGVGKSSAALRRQCCSTIPSKVAPHPVWKRTATWLERICRYGAGTFTAFLGAMVAMIQQSGQSPYNSWRDWVWVFVACTVASCVVGVLQGHLNKYLVNYEKD